MTIAQDVTTVIDVLDNDTDPQDDIDEDTLDVISNPSHGTATEHSNGTITYNPDSTFTGTDSFIYEICDEDDNCDTATVTIYVGTSSGNHAPVALDDTATTPKATAKTINVIANDSDSDNNLSNTVTIVMQPSNGTAS